MNTTDFQLDQNGNYTYNDPGFVIATLTYIDGVSSIATTNGTYGLNAEFNNFNFSSPNTHCATATVKIFLDNNLIQTDTYIVGVDSWVDASTPIWCQSDVADFYVSSPITLTSIIKILFIINKHNIFKKMELTIEWEGISGVFKILLIFSSIFLLGFYLGKKLNK